MSSAGGEKKAADPNQAWIDELRQKCKPFEVVVTGSRAWGLAHLRSDLNLVVLARADKHDDVRALLKRLFPTILCDADPRGYVLESAGGARRTTFAVRSRDEHQSSEAFVQAKIAKWSDDDKAKYVARMEAANDATARDLLRAWQLDTFAVKVPKQDMIIGNLLSTLAQQRGAGDVSCTQKKGSQDLHVSITTRGDFAHKTLQRLIIYLDRELTEWAAAARRVEDQLAARPSVAPSPSAMSSSSSNIDSTSSSAMLDMARAS